MSMDVEETSTIGKAPQVINMSGLDDVMVRDSTELREVANQLNNWVEKQRRPTTGNMFDRQTYTPPDNVYDEMRSARFAVKNDDIVSGVAETTEGFAFNGVKWESEEQDEADVFNQLNADLNLDAVVRRMWREEFTYSMACVATVWGWKEYTVRGRTTPEEVGLDKVTTTDPDTGQATHDFVERRDPDTNMPIKRGKGKKKKKKYKFWAPTQMRVLDATKIVPLGIGPLGNDMYAWQATPGEIGLWQDILDETKVDVGMSTFFLGKYEPADHEEKALLSQLGVNTERLLVINPEYVFVHTLTKPDYERHADIRLKSCFGLLDLKHQLMDADRATLVGAANYILLVKKGSKEEPAQQAEIENLKENYNFLAKLPVIISDHRLEIEIIAPKVDLTLQSEKYDVIDTRLLSRLLGTLSLGSRGQRNETNVTLSYAVARAMENRRHMLKRTLEKHIAKAICGHKLNEGTFTEEPNLVYTPRNITLGFDAALVQALQNLRTQNDISRETILEFFGLDQGAEAVRKENEEENFDHIFNTAIPFSSPNMGGANGMPPPGPAGAMGGRPAGGGTPPANSTKAKPKSLGGGNTSTKKGST